MIGEIERIKDALHDLECNYQRIADKATPAVTREYNRTYNALDKQLKLCSAQCEEFERWYAAIPDRYIQACVGMHYIDGVSWSKVGTAMGRKGSAVRKAVERYFKKEALEKE